MLHFVEHRRGETISWRDPADIRSEIGETSKAFATLWERYTEHLTELEKEMRDTLCLLQRM